MKTQPAALIRAAFLTLFTIGFIGDLAFGGDLIEKIKEKGTLVVAQVGAEQPPFFWKTVRDNKEKWIGYEVDLAGLIADKLGVNLEILRLGEDYNEVCEVVAAGKADIGLSNLSDTEARRKLVDFTKPYIVSRVAMLVDVAGLERDGIDAIEPLDLNRPDVNIALTQESAYAFVQEELMPDSAVVISPQGTFEQICEPMLRGDAHAIVDDGLTMVLGMRTHPEYVGRYLLHIFDQYDDPLSMCLPKDQPEMQAFLESIIDEIEEEEPITLELLVDKYMK